MSSCAGQPGSLSAAPQKSELLSPSKPFTGGTAMAANITDSLWELEDIVNLLDKSGQE